MTGILRYFLLNSLFIFVWMGVKISSLGRATVWRRHSLVLGYWTKDSDLDLTVLASNENNYGLFSFLEILKSGFCRKVIDLELFCDADLPLLAKFGNFFELSRDPRLARRVSLGRGAEAGEREAFWIRNGLADPRGLRGDPGREKKWDHHRRLLGVSCSKKSSAEHIEEVYRDFFTPLVPPGLKELETLQDGEWGYYLLPHRWLGGARRDGLDISAHSIKMDAENSALCLVKNAQMKWEFYKLLLRMRIHPNEAGQTIDHLEQINKMATNAQLKSDFESALSHIKEALR